MTRGRVGLAAALAILGSGCWPAPGQNADRTSYNPSETVISVDTVGDLAEDWTAQLDAGEAGAPVLSVGRVHVADGNAVYAISAGEGARLWRRQLVDSDPIPIFFDVSDAFVVDDDLVVSAVYFALGGGGTTWVLDPATGAVDQELNTGELQAVRSSQGAAVSTLRGTDVTPMSSLNRVDLAAGSVLTSGLLHIGTADHRSTLGRNFVYVTGTAGLPPFTTVSSPPFTWTEFDHAGVGLHAFPRTGGNACVPKGTTPDPNFQYVCGTWATPLDGAPTAPVIGADETVLYVGTGAGTVYAVDAATGAVLWTAPAGAGVSGTPALAGGRLYVPTAAGELRVLDAATGAPLWSASTDGGARQPAVAGGVVFTGSASGQLHAFAAAGCATPPCDPLWSTSTGSAITGAPAVSNGRLYVGTADGRLISYR